MSHNTKVNEHKHVFTGTAVAARFIQEQCMNRSQSQRQVVILDCCFSGAFAEGMSAKNAVRIINIDIAAQLGGEGRAVLTSSTATQVSFEDQGGGVYTQYLIEGMEKGAADTDDDGVITVAELHEYAKRKVQEAKPAMKPEIYAVREGYTIHLAKAPVGDPKLEYRKEVEKCVRKDGSFSVVGRRILDRRQKELKLTLEEATAIKEEVLKPFREFQQSLQEYEQVLVEVLEDEPVLSDETREELRRLQQILKLRDEDITAIHQRLDVKQILPDEDDLSSEKGIDYTKLRDLLKAKKWKEADYETYLVMIKAVGKKENEWFEPNQLLNFPCTDLRTIDQLWIKYSNGFFGFSIQKQIYLEVDGKLNGKYCIEAWEKFGDRVGWRIQGKWVSYSNVTFDISAHKGYLPLSISVFVNGWTRGFGLGEGGSIGLFSCIESCQSPISLNIYKQKNSLHPTDFTVEDDLNSEKGIDYTKLRDLLKAKKWKEADYETYLVMIKAVGKKENEWFEPDELLNFPCTDLRTIDQLWLKYSDGRFGFSIQKQIYLEVGGKLDGKYYKQAWEKLGDRVGWRVKGRWISYSYVTFDISAHKGYLPRSISVFVNGWAWGLGLGGGGSIGLFSCIESCQSPISLNVDEHKNSVHPTYSIGKDDLSSEKGIDYTKLRDLLKAQQWKEADYETYLVMIQAVEKKENDWFLADELLNFPCTDLRTIDQLWVQYSDGRFSFNIQKQIYLEVGGRLDGKYYKEAWEKFGDRIGWRVKGNWISYSQITFNTSAPEGHLPRHLPFSWFSSDWSRGLFSRIETCKI